MPDKKSPAASEDNHNPPDSDTRSAHSLTEYARQSREQWDADQASTSDDNSSNDDTTAPEPPEDTDAAPQIGSTTHDLKKEAALALHMQFEKDQADDTPTTESTVSGDVVTPTVTALRLTITDQEPPLEVPLTAELIIGRGDVRTRFEPDIDLTPYGAYRLGISRRHARILYQDESLYLVDSGSRNGTAINGKSLTAKEPYPLQDGDVVRCGNLQLTVQFVT